jgi:hypothetical protein
MKKLIYVIAVFFAINAVAAAQETVATPKKEVQKTTYVCPMHPKEVSDKKGKCGKCGMDLAPVKEKKSTAKQTKYVCTMDGSVSDKPGKCPKCGMAMTEKKPEKK